MKTFTFPDAGPSRFWHVAHQPTKVKVLRIELREKLSVVRDKASKPSLSSLIGWINSDATDDDVLKACEELKRRTGRALEFLGVFDGD